jgi:adenylate cyclase class 1
MRYLILRTITLQNNKNRYLAYNAFRKNYFLANSPKDSPIILYMLPWLLSVNRQSVPGYIKELKEPFHVFNVTNDKEIFKQETLFKKQFAIKEDKSLIRHASNGCPIEGIYTIGSVGTISQTTRSDCDIWICIDKTTYNAKSLKYLNEKINLIKGWFDERLKIPVYFFLVDVEDVRNCRFGEIDYESSGSAQKNVLKEEFYRTSILICGKIPFWWVCYDQEAEADYNEELSKKSRDNQGDYDLIDLGNLDDVDQTEYFGAALWQFNKSLTHPLKSIIKMLQLKMFLETPKEELLCYKFRQRVLEGSEKAEFPDPSLFTMRVVLDYFSSNGRKDHFEFIKKCFYLRFDLKLLSKTQTHKEEMAGEIFKIYKIDRKDIYHLNEFEFWKLTEKINFGGLMFEFLSDIYKDIVKIQKGINLEIAPQDLTIIGRKLSSSLAHKENKVPVLHNPTENIKLPVFTFATSNNMWQVSSSDDLTLPLIANDDIIFCLTYMAWNSFYDQNQIRMKPNHTSITLQEIINLGRKIKEVFGTYDITGVHFSNLLDDEKIRKILLIISFETGPSTNMNINDICLVYKNNWEELFVRRFSSADKMKIFFNKAGKMSDQIETHYYVQRNNKYYEKIIDRTKNIIDKMLSGN